MSLFQALLLATSLGWTIVEAIPPPEAAPPAVGLPAGPKYGNNITSIAWTGTDLPPAPIVRTEKSQASLNVPCQTCPTYNSPRVESTQAALDGPGKPTEPSGPQITHPPATKQSQVKPDEPTGFPSPPKPNTTPAASILPPIPTIEKPQTDLHLPSPTGDSHKTSNPEDSPLTSPVLTVGTQTLSGTALLSYLTEAPAYTIGPSHTIHPGSPAIIISGTTYSAAATGTELYANGDVVSTTLPIPTGSDGVGEAILSALGITVTRTGSGIVTSTTTATASGNSESGTATESQASLQMGGAESIIKSKRRILLGSVGVGVLGLIVALL